MTDYINVPIAAAGDWIDDAYLNTYLGDNFRAVFGSLTAAGQLLVSLAANRLSKVAVTGNAGYLLTEDPAEPGKMKFAAPVAIFPAGGTKYQGLRVAADGSTKEWGTILNVGVRQGGSATDWSAPGTGTYIPAQSVAQVGAVSIALSGGPPAIGSGAVAFPVAFAYKPIIFLTMSLEPLTVATHFWTQLEWSGLTVSGFNISIGQDTNASYYTPRTVNWLAIGVLA